MKIEATGNTKEQAENALANKRDSLKEQANYSFGEIAVYGNFELGYKLVQEYWPAI